MKKNQNKSNKAQKTQKNQRGYRNTLAIKDSFTRTVLRPGTIAPTSVMSTMKFVSEIGTLSNASTFIVRRFRANSIFDPDPLLGGTTYAGYTAKSALYRQYRATHTAFSWGVSNMETFPVQVAVVITNVDLGPLIGTLQQARDVVENSFSTDLITLGGSAGTSTASIDGKLPLWKVLGDEGEYMNSTSYSSLNNTNPAVTIFISFIVLSQTGANLTNGVSFSPTITTTIKWYNRQINFD